MQAPKVTSVVRLRHPVVRKYRNPPSQDFRHRDYSGLLEQFEDCALQVPLSHRANPASHQDFVSLLFSPPRSALNCATLVCELPQHPPKAPNRSVCGAQPPRDTLVLLAIINKCAAEGSLESVDPVRTI